MYQALYRKYRPQTFDEVVGQRSVTETLKNQLISGKLSHAYLFTGTRGTGKTSCAKILSKAVNCLDPQNGNPCNCCAACRSIDSGACMDVLEIDAASNNGVDNVRVLRDDAIYTPAEVRMRVYIIDEVHMLSTAAFNALLKIIEEPPEHLLFILATTELNKVPATILSRCQRFSFRRLLPEDIAGRIQYVSYTEGIEIAPEAVKLLSRLADGALRDGMSLLDQCASATEGAVTADVVYRVLGLAGERRTAELMQAIADRDSAKALELFAALYAGGKDVTAMLGELTDLARDLLVLKTAPQSGERLLTTICTKQEREALLPRFTAAELLRVVELLQQTAAGFAKSANRRIDAELCLMQLCSAELNLDLGAVNARLARLEQEVRAGAILAPRQPVREQTVQAEPEQAAPPVQAPAPPPAPVADDFWPALKQKLQESLQPPAAGFFRPNTPVTGQMQGEDTLQICVDSAFTKTMLTRPEAMEAIHTAAVAFLGRNVRIDVTVGQTAGGVDRMQELLEFGEKHRDLIDIQ